VNSALERPVPLFLHFDAEFESLEGLVRGTLTGRNFGWLQDENETAVAHIAGVIKNDDGRGELAKEFGGIPYKILLKGEAAEIPEEFRIPENFRIDVENADGKEILNAVAKLIGAYVQDLVFIRDDTGAFAGSPYDKFLEMNGLPRKPQAGETDLEYARRLLELINKLEDIQYVAQGRDGEFAFHEQDFRFGPDELKGLKIFFAEAPASGLAPSHQPETDPPQAGAEAGGIGNCIACHAPPAFTDFKFHNTGVTQAEYDLTHSGGAFQALFIPDYFERNAKPELYLPPSPLHPYAAGKFFDIPSLDRPGATDLGLWNVLGNPNVSHQEKLLRLLCEQHSMAEADCVPEKLLPLTVAQFKTPGLRDMGHSAPYMHNGEMDELKDVVEHYRTFSDLARKGEMRNAPEEFSGLALGEADVSLLVNFLESLNEDYE
jgi:hypothetical protein